MRDVAGAWPEKDSLQREPREHIDTGFNTGPRVCAASSCPWSCSKALPPGPALLSTPLWSQDPSLVPAGRSLGSSACSPLSLGGGFGGPSGFLSALRCPSSSSSPSGNSHCDSPERSLT